MTQQTDTSINVCFSDEGHRSSAPSSSVRSLVLSVPHLRVYLHGETEQSVTDGVATDQWELGLRGPAFILNQ